MSVPARFFGTTDELRAWFESHHADASELWIGFYKAHTGKGGVVYRQAVDEALCFGWIDTTIRRIDEDRYTNRFTPRRPGSYWSVVNRRRFAALRKAGRVHPAGRHAFERRPTKEPQRYSSERSFRLSSEFASRLRRNHDAERFFRSRRRGFRRMATFWVMSAARPETRERRFATLLGACAVATIPAALVLPGESAPPPRRPAGALRTSAPRRRQSNPGSR